MAWGGGVFTRTYGSTAWQTDASNNVGIVPDRHDSNDQDLADGINACINKAGGNTPTADLPMGGYKHTNLSAGSAAAPTFCAGNDQDTGMFSPAANQIGIATNGVERFRINSSGQTIMTAGVAGGFAASVTNTNTGATSYGLIIDQARSDYALAVRDNTNIYRHIFNANGTATIGLTTNPAITINAGGEVLCGTAADNGNYNLQCNGTGVWGAGAYVNGSDERIKEDIAPLGDSLNIINALNPVTFKYKEEWINDSTTQPGFIAQEVEQVLSNEIYKDGIVQAGGQYMGLAYQSLIPLIVKAMQELSKKLDALIERVEALEA